VQQKLDNHVISTLSFKAFRHHIVMAIIAITLSACGGGSSEPTIAVNIPVVTPVDTLPLAVADSFSTNQNTTLTANLAANDTGLDDSPVIFSLDTPANNGVVTVTGNGVASFIPETDFSGTDSFVYVVTDADGDVSTATVSITVIATVVTPVDTLPLAVADSFSTNQNTTLTANLAANDTGLDDSPIIFSLDTPASNGVVTVMGNGSASYIPGTDFNGTDSFVYVVTDADGDASTAKVSITVIATNASSFWPAVNSVVTTNVDATVGFIVAEMTIGEKVGQMVQAEIGGVNVAQVRQYDLGSVLNGGGTWPNGKNSSIADWVTLADSFYEASTDVSDGGVGIPLIWGTDAVHGHNNVVGATIFPHNIGLGAANNPDLMRQIGEATALEVAVTGIDWVFAPTLAVVRNDRWGRTYEGYSEDPEIVKAYAGEVVIGLQGDDADRFGPAHVIATAKHFIGDGGTQNGTDQGNTVVSETELRDIHAQGYLSALGAGAQTVMASYNSWNGSKLHGDNYLLTEVLKEQMGFDGFVIGDWNGHGQVPGCTDNQCAQAIKAGVDMIMVPFAWQEFIQNTIAQVENGTIPMARIDDAVTRILRVKMRAGFADKVKPSLRAHANDSTLMGSTAHRDIARQAVRESLVLLKNSNNILPLAANANVMVTGSGANNIGMQSGGWTLSWQGMGNANADFPGATSVYGGIESLVNAGGGTTRLSTNGAFSGTTPDVAIVVFGETPYAEGVGDLNNIEYQAGDKSDLALLESLRAQNIPVVSIFLTGRPLWVNKELNASNAFVVAWLPGSEGAGIAEVIFKTAAEAINYDFSGKLSFSWPKSTDQTVINRNDADYDPLFAYGFGLTYQDTDTLGDNLDTTDSSTGQPSVVFSVPGTIEAEQFAAMNGVQTEASTDSGGGTGGSMNVGYIDIGDWLEYNIDVQTPGQYLIEYRLASNTGSNGFITLSDGTEIDSQSVPNTGGWQSWITQSATVDLPSGTQTLRINALGPQWNINWIRFSLAD
jgi:beta-glucosidase